MRFDLGIACAVFADTIFNFSFETSGVHGNPGTMIGGSGLLDTQATSTPGTFLIEGISGSTGSGAIYGAISRITGGVGDLFPSPVASPRWARAGSAIS